MSEVDPAHPVTDQSLTVTSSVYANTIENPGFETGDLTGWTVIEGEAFGPNSVSDETMYWAEGIPYQQEGNFHLNGWRNQETAFGRLRSSTFTLAGTGWVSFMLGGGRHTDQEYIEIRDADTDEVIARYGNTEWSDANFPNVETGLRLANFVKYSADLSGYIGRNLYVDIVDNGSSDWGLLFVDSVNVYHETKPMEGIRTDNLYDSGVKEIQNPGFESGDLSGWTVVEGDAFGPDSLSDESTYFDEQIPYNQEGQYHLNGWKYPEDKTGIIRSSTFKLSGTGWMSFRMGGGKNTDLVHIDVYDAATNERLARYGNTEFAEVNFPHVDQGLRLANMVLYKADLRAFLGENLYIEIVDQATTDWGVVFVDDFKTYIATTPTDGIVAQNLHNPVRYELRNPGFEEGSLSGWTIVAGNAFGPGSVSSDTTWWDENVPYEQEGNYHLNGWMYEEKKTGVLRSSTFTLGGTGWITFKLGGGKSTSLVHIDIYNADTDELVARYGNTEFADISFPHIDQGMRLANMVQYRADLSEHLDEDLYLEIVDNADSDWGIVFADAFFTLHDTIPAEGVLATNLFFATPETIENPGFEAGNLSGWAIDGEAFNDAATSEIAFGDNQTPYGHVGAYHVSGYGKADDRIGKLTSGVFRLGGNGAINFLVGGGADPDTLYVALVRASDHTVLMKATGHNSDVYSRVNWDAAPYIGQEMYIQVVDQNTGTYGHINVDDFEVKGIGLIGSWNFNEGSGVIAKDQVRNRNDAVNYVFNNAKYKPDNEPLWRDGVAGKGLLFDGYSTWVARPANEIAKPSDEITIEAWVSPRSYEWGDQGKLSAIVNQYDSANRTGYILGMGRHGRWSFQAGINGKWNEVWAADNKPLKKFEWSHVAATYSKTDGQLKLYLNGELVGTSAAEKKLAISSANTEFMIGKNNSGAVINGVFTANMFNGMIDEVKVYNKALNGDEIENSFNTVKSSFDGGILPTPSMDFDRSIYDGDRYRPQYHLIAPGHWMNEPHAPLYFEGKYHIFYQFNPQGPYWHQIHWGHAVSDDMVHWQDMPVALAPEAGSETPDGVWSGSATLDENGNPALLFTAGNDNATPNQATGLARSTYPDDGDIDLEKWVYHGSPVTTQAPDLPADEGEVWYGNFRDPFVWKDGDTWYQLMGSGIKNVGGTALLYSSQDLVNWTYENPFFVGDYDKYQETGQVWELPVFLPLGKDSSGTMKYAFFINPWFDHYNPHNVKYVFHWIGTWDKVNNKFVPDHEEPRLFDFGEHFTGPSGMVDAQGRSILFSIAQDRRTEQQHSDAGWAHNGGLPVVLSLRGDNTLGVEPIQELHSLRGQNQVDIANATTVEEANSALQHVQGDMLEILLEARIDTANMFGISVRKTPDGKEETKLFYDAENKTLNLDRWKSSLDPDVQKGIQNGSMELDGNILKLHIYLDRSMIEAYANGKNSMTSRVYPTRGDALGLELWQEGGNTVIQKLQVWTMHSAYGSEMPSNWPASTPVTELVGELPNADFEKGDLSGWTAEGNAFTEKNVVKVNDWGWGGPFNQAWSAKDPERYHLWGFNPEVGDAGQGTLRSQNFILGGNGKISFLIGGGKEVEQLYVALVRASDNEILMKETGDNNEAYRRITWDASAFKGQQLYIEIVDQHTGGWGHISFDNLNVPVALHTNGNGNGNGSGNGSQPVQGQTPPNNNIIPIKPEDIKKENNEKGGITAKVNVENDTLRSLLDGLSITESSVVTIDIPSNKGESLELSLPLAELVDAAKKSSSAVISIKYGNVTYDLPLELLKQATGNSGTLLMSIEPQSDEILNDIQQRTSALNMKMMSDAFDFKMSVESDGETSELTEFGNLYVVRTLTVDSMLDSDTSTAVMYDPITGNVTFVPSTFEHNDAQTVVTVKRNGNSIYTVVQSDKAFDDIRGHWAEKDIQLLASKHILFGVDEAVFSPKINVTRAEFAAIVTRGLGLPERERQLVKFTDVSDTAWYSGAVYAAVHSGIIVGYQDGSFKPNQWVTRAEMAVMLSRASKYAGKTPASDSNADQLLAQFADASEISAWARAAMGEMVQANLLKGDPEAMLNSGEYLTRAEAAAVMKRFLNHIGFIGL